MEDEQDEEEESEQKTKNKKQLRINLRTQLCLMCNTPMGDMPGTRDAYCPNCGYKDPCCE